MDVNLYSLILAVVSFIIGTLIPIIYRRFSHEGLSIQQPFPADILISTGNHDSNKNVFVTVVKIANAQKDSVLIDDIQLALPTKSNFDTRLTEIKIKYLSPNDVIYAPIDLDVQVTMGKKAEAQKEYHFPKDASYAVLGQPTSFSYLPFIVKAGDELLMAIQFSLPKVVFDELFDQVDEAPNSRSKEKLKKLKFRVNGKYRTYEVYVRDTTTFDN